MKSLRNRFEKGLLSILVLTTLAPVQVRADLGEISTFAASDSSEAELKFKYRVEFKASAKEVDEDFAREKIQKQLTYLFGPMGVAQYKAVPKGNDHITGIQVTRKTGTRNEYVATYSYRGIIDLQFGPGSTYEVIIPINPDQIYQAGLITRSGGEKYNPCTDDHYQDEGDFWYFWNPEMPNCPLQLGKDYERVSATVVRIANTTQTFPEYPRLVNDQGVIRIDILMGMDDPEKDHDPGVSTDINARNYRGIRRTLTQKMGFTSRVLDRAELKARSGKSSPLPYVEEFSLQTPKGKILITLFFGQSGIDEKSGAFHHFFKDALENASVMMYDGHSGLGGHLDLEDIEAARNFKVAPPKNRYQIYYFNSCSSYTYYNTRYFARKKSKSDPKGTKNLDILTNGLATYFSVIGETDMIVVQAIVDWATRNEWTTYQKLAAEIDSDNLFGVNGDEDNPVKPE